MGCPIDARKPRDPVKSHQTCSPPKLKTHRPRPQNSLPQGGLDPCNEQPCGAFPPAPPDPGRSRSPMHPIPAKPAYVRLLQRSHPGTTSLAPVEPTRSFRAKEPTDEKSVVPVHHASVPRRLVRSFSLFLTSE